MAKRTIHVVPSPSGKGWDTKTSGNPDPKSHHRTQQNAIERAKEMATQLGTELVIHGKDGRIRDKDSYGNDPNPPKDTKH